MQAILDSSREMLSDLPCHSLLGFEPLTTPQLQLQLPEVREPSQYLIDMGFQPTIARQLSKTYMDFVAQHRTTWELHFNRAIQGGRHLPTECYREVFVVLFGRAIRAWDSEFVSMVRVRICQVGARQASFHPERVDIRVDDVAKAGIIARLGLKATHFTSDRMVTSPNADMTSRREEPPEQTHALSTDTANSRLMLSGSPPTSSTSRHDLFSQVAPRTCFPAPYPPPPASCLPQNPLVTSFIPPARPRDVRSLASYSPDVSSLTNLFGRMSTTTLGTDLRAPRSHGVFRISDPNRIKSLSATPSSGIADNSTEPQPLSVESITSPIKPTNTPRRRKIASLPTRRGKTLASQSSPVFDSAGAISLTITPRFSERVVVDTPKSRPFIVENLPCVKSPSAIHRRGVMRCHADIFYPQTKDGTYLHHKTLPQSHIIPHNQVLAPLATAGETLSYTSSRSPPLVSDATSYFDSPPTSSDELDTPPSTPPRSHVLLARTSTEGLAISPESSGIVSRKEPLGDAGLLNTRQRYVHLDFTKGFLGRDEQPLTFTFGV